MKRTHAKVGATRSHHRLSASALTKCPHCGAVAVRHQVCASCGMYRGRQIVDVAKKGAKKSAGKK
jgi:large subunit ribosomal protein L32